MKGRNVKVLACLAAVALVLAGAGNALAKAKGPCVSCHTMHNSQDGVSVTGTGPVEALLAYQSCYACHSGTNTGLDGLGVMNGTGIPYVFDSNGAPLYDNLDDSANSALAGGNFYWVATVDDTRGHNVLSTDDTTIDGSTVVQSYRFLLGIVGLEDEDWEFTKDATDHNQYKGSADTVDGSTISYLCCECHGQFHTAAGSNGESGAAPWLRHPTDYDMNGTLGTTEYLDYNVDNSYSIEAPVASTDVSAVKSAVLAGAGDAIVTCVSCHRAHGSPYEDLLRWDYSTMIAGNGSNTDGCFVCHTTKDDL
ncbi:MAG: cytochrome c3 family protein [Desulfuromonadaceae bacterium]